MRKAILIFGLLFAAVSVSLVLELRQPVSSPPSASSSVREQEGSPSRPERPLFGGAPMATSPGPQDPELAQIFGPLFDTADEDKAVSAVYFDLTGRLRAHPELIAKLESMLATEQPDKAAVRIAVGALAGAGTREAQSALARLIDTRKADGRFLQLLVPTMGFATNPTPELEGALRRLANSDQPDGLRRMAHLALGNAAGHMQDNPARSQQIIDGYDRMLASATREDDVVTYLGVVGNAATPQSAQIAERYLHDERTAVRAKAVSALRLVPTEEAERELTTALQKDADAAVRATAATALGYHKASPALIQAEADALSTERDPQVARRLLDNLWTSGSNDHDAQVAVASAAESHPVPAIREQARKLLAQSNAAQGS